jgi:hypothetical protein
VCVHGSLAPPQPRHRWPTAFSCESEEAQDSDRVNARVFPGQGSSQIQHIIASSHGWSSLATLFFSLRGITSVLGRRPAYIYRGSMCLSMHRAGTDTYRQKYLEQMSTRAVELQVFSWVWVMWSGEMTPTSIGWIGFS